MRISANLGFLFRGSSLPDAIRAAKKAGFDAVELHWPYNDDPGVIADVLAETGMPLLSINTSRGNLAVGEFGLLALPNRELEAQASIDQAVAWAVTTGCRAIHVMAGAATGDAAFTTFVRNLQHAAEKTIPHGIKLLIEPLNDRDAPSYFVDCIEKASRVIEASGGIAKIMFDCYHMQLLQGDLLKTFEKHLDFIGHVQFAAVPDRTEPDHGEVDYGWLLPAILATGYQGYFGAEYQTASGSFEWISRLKTTP